MKKNYRLKINSAFRDKKRISAITLAILSFQGQNVMAKDVTGFNTDILSSEDKENIDFSRFDIAGYIPPGTYDMKVVVNSQDLGSKKIRYYADDSAKGNSVPCLNKEIVEEIAFKEKERGELHWSQNGECLNVSDISGVMVDGDLSTAKIDIQIPKVYLEYSDDSWDPPARWDDGIPGIMADYNIIGNTYKNTNSGTVNSLNSNGVIGTNAGPWRARADWQGQTRSGERDSSSNAEFSRYYAFRALPSIRSKLEVGESYFSSGVLDTFRFTGIKLNSEEGQLPPNLRGYSAAVTGIANTNAKVTVSQQGQIIYETNVPAGPFSINDLNSVYRGELDVTVEEQDGSVKHFTVNTASIPYLTRPGLVRYNLAAGRPSDLQHHLDDPKVVGGDFSWGISNGWSLFGGSLLSEKYQALAVGLGRDLEIFGALSVDVTTSRADLPEKGTLSGNSYRVNYSKSFDELNSQISFAGYRFSQKEFLSMNDYLSRLKSDSYEGKNKEYYTVIFNKNFTDSGLSTFVNYSYQSYWDRPVSERWSINLSKYFSLGRLKNISATLSAYRQTSYFGDDKGGYLSFSLPFGSNGTLGVNSFVTNRNYNHNVSYNARVNDRTNYQVSTGIAKNGYTASGYTSYRSDVAELNVSGSAEGSSYSSASLGVRGGITATRGGVALHPSYVLGGTRMMVDTEGVADVPINAGGRTIRTNRAGIAVISDVTNYYKNQVRIDVNKLPKNAESTDSIKQFTLTEGAIGYRKFAVISGQKALAVIRNQDGSYPPFGATVKNSRKQEVGIVSDSGNVYLSGLKPSQKLTVTWGKEGECEVSLPENIPETSSLLLPCIRPVNTQSINKIDIVRNK